MSALSRADVDHFAIGKSPFGFASGWALARIASASFSVGHARDTAKICAEEGAGEERSWAKSKRRCKVTGTIAGRDRGFFLLPITKRAPGTHPATFGSLCTLKLVLIRTGQPVISSPGSGRSRLGALAALKDGVMIKRLQEEGSEPRGGTPEELAKYLRAEHARWGGIVRISGVKPE